MRGGANIIKSDNDTNNYNYEINLNAVNKSLNNNASGGVQGVPSFNPSRQVNDYDNNPKNIYMNKNNVQNQRQGDKCGSNNVIIEMEAENNEDESYYLS